MSPSFHAPPSHAEPIYRWYKRAQVDYVEHYIRLYIAYNAWYREVTGTLNDREALAQLKKRTIIWDDYKRGVSLKPLKIYMARLVDLTQAEPLGKTQHWSGVVQSPHDWRSLIEYWYQVRCLLVHGTPVNSKYVWLAYETLDAFMGEIVDRMYKALEVHTQTTSIGHTSALKSVNLSQLQRKLQAQYLTSPNIWQVDMQHAQDE